MLGRTTLTIPFVLMALFSYSKVFASGIRDALPAHLQQMKQHALQRSVAPNKRLLSPQEDGEYRFALSLKQANINLRIKNIARNKTGSQSFASSFKTNGKDYSLIFTQGESGGFGELRGNGQHLIIEQYQNQVYVFDVGLSGLTPGVYENDTIGKTASLSAFRAPALNTQASSNESIVDVMLLYTQNIVDTFPGDMTDALLEHLVFKANQSFVDSQIDLRLRLVHTEFVDYPNPSSIVALNELRAALDNNSSTQTVPSLSQIAQLQQTYGADLVSMIRTHDLNEREVCGIAMFPDPAVDFLVNVSNVGISGGSNCIDTFTHEVGHNFGAGHQRSAGASVGAREAAGALIVDGKFNTLMSSIGTGDVNRDYGLPVFSNPNITCATLPCGDVATADNADTINFFAPINAALRAGVIETPIEPFFQSVTDIDGDTVIDQNDAFPFDSTESLDSDGDGVGDNADVFPNDASEQVDTDQDGLGNNSDADDDNDGVIDINDDLPLDAGNTIDADGDGVGANEDALDNNQQEFQNSDDDFMGDRNDLDDDNDGVPDYYLPTTLAESEAWVVSAGSDNILRFNSESGDFIASLLEVPIGGFSFRSDAVLSVSQQLYFISFSDVLAFDRNTNSVREVINRSRLNTNFPVHLLFQTDTNLLINNGLGTSNIEPFRLMSTGNLSGNTASDEAVWRDMLLLSNNRLIVAERSSNRLLLFTANNLNVAPTVFSTQGLNKPEHMTLASNGDFYVTNAGSKDVSRFSNSGAFLGTFITAGSGGLGKPSCITSGPQGDIYVCSEDSDQILKYDGQTGAFLKVFVETGAGGLKQPVSLVFAGLAQDEFRTNGEHDSDGDLVNNIDDDLPLDASETIDTDIDGIGNNADSDDDNDSIPDTYETANNMNPLDASDAQLDNDNDTYSNLQEFEAGTNPNDANSAPEPVFLPVPPEESGGGGAMSFLFLLYVLAVYARRRQKSFMNS